MVDPQTYTTKFSFQLKPVTQEGSHLRLEPLSESHIEELVSLFDPEIGNDTPIRLTLRMRFVPFFKEY